MNGKDGRGLGAAHCSASEQTEFETFDEVWNALAESRAEIARLRKLLDGHKGYFGWGATDAIKGIKKDETHE